MKFAATRKDNGEAVLLNGGKSIAFMATSDKAAQSAVASNMPAYIVAEFRNDAGVAIRVQWKENGTDRYRDVGVGETGVVELVFSQGDTTKKEVKFAATRKDNGEAVLLNGGKSIAFMATSDKAAQSAVASNMPAYIVAEFRNDAGVAIRVQWKENGTDRYRDVGVGETGVVELVFSQGDTTKKEVKFAATRKDNGEAVLLNGGKSIAFMATSDKAAQSAVASNMPAYIVAEFRNDAGVAIRVQWKENGTDRYRDVGVGETGVVELVFSQGDTTKKEVKFAATRKDNGEAVLLNGGKSIAFMATSDKAAQSAVASNMPAYIVAEFRNDAGVAIRVQWKENGTDRYRDVGVGETGVVELVFSQGDTTKKEVKFAATRKDNGEAVLLNGGKSIAFMATSDKAAQSAVASNMPAYIVAEFRNDAGVAIRVQWKENGTDRYRDVGVGETGVVELVFSQGDTTKKEVKFAATRKDNGEAVLLNGGKSIAFMATSDKAAQSAVASNMPAYIVAEFRNDAGVAIRVQWKENGTDRYRDVGVGETGVVELVFSQGDTTKKEVKFAATRKDNGEAVLLNGGKSIAFMATSDKAAQSAVASNMPAYIVAEFRNDAGVAIRVQWKENGTDRYRDVGVGETGVVELVFSQGDTTKKEVKFAATRKDNGEAVLLNGGKSIAFMATSDKAAQSAVASNMPAYIVAEFRNDAGVAIRVQWKENGTDRYRDVGVGETGVVELVFSQGDTTKKEVKFAATRKDNGEAVLLNGGKSIAFMATSDKAAQSAVASNMPAYIVAEFRNDAGVAIRVQWKENGTDRYRDVGVGETGVVELVFSQGDTTKKEVKFAATRKDNGEAVLLNGGKSIAFMATSDKAAQSAVASNMPAYIVAEFRNDAGVAIRVQWKENGTDRYRDVGVGETGVVELVFSQGDTTKKEVKFAATRKDNGEAVLLNGGKSIAFMATSDKAAQSAVASNMPAYIVAEFRNDAGVAIRVQWKENGTDRYRDVGVGETGVVELVFSQGDTTKKEVKFAATRKDNGEAVLLNGGKSIAFMATSDKAAQSAVASNMPAYIVAEFRNDAGVAIRVQWKENGTDRYRDVGVGETGVVELVFSQGDTTKKEVKFAATRKDNGEAVLLNGGKSIAFMATSDKAAQSAVASNMPAYIVAEFRNDAGVAIRVQWKENGTDRYRDVGVGETGVVELVFSQGDTTKKEVKFAATRKDNGEAVLLNGGKSIAFMATSDKAAQSAVASNMPAYIVAEFRNDAGVAIRVQWKENGTDRYRDVGVGETGVVELVFSQGDTTKKEVKFAATRKDNGEAVLLNGGKSIAFMATSDKAAQSAVASNMPAYIVAEFRNDAGVAIRVQWKENGTDRYRDVGVGETGVVELVFSQGDTTKKEVKFAATRKDNGEAVLLNGGKSIAFMATSDKAAQSAVASNMPAYIVAEFRNDAGVAIRVQWKENGTDRYRDVGVGETGVVELVFSQGDTTKKEVKFAATRKDNGEAVLLNGGKSIAFMATSDKAAQSAVASNMPAYIVAEFRNDAGVAIRVQWKENGTDRYRDVGVGETGVVELVFSQGDTTKKEVKFAATRKDNGEAVLLNGGKSIAFMATSDKAAQSAVASNMPAYIVAEFRNDAGVAIRVQWKENGTDRYRDVGVGETGVVELVFSQGDTTKKEVKFAATRKDNGEAVLLNGGKSIAFMATSDKAAQSAVASNMPAYIVAEFRNDAGVAIRVQWKENGTDRYRDVGVGETGVVELVFSQGDTTKKEVKFAATRKDNGEAVLLNGGKSIAFMATSDKAAQSAVASNMPAYIVAEFRNDAGVAIRVQWKENGTDRYRDVGVGETGVVELVFSQGDTTKKEVKFAATRKDNGEAVLLNGGKSIAFMATSDKAAQSAVASNMPAYIVAEFRNDAGVAIRVQWKENGTDRYRDVGVGETGVVELVFSQGDTTKKEVKFAATRKDNGEAVLLNGGKSIAFMATSDKAAQSAVASNMPAYIVAEFRNDAGVAIRVQWKENGTDRYRDVGVGETGVVELVFSQGDTTKKEVKFAATRKDNGEAVLLNGGKSIAFMATSDKAAQSAVASNMPAYIVAEFRNDAGVAIRVQWKENGTDRYRDVGVGETGVVELVFSQGDTTKKEVKFAATRKDNGEAVLLNGGKSIAFMATSDKAAQSAVASNMPAYIVAEFRNDAGVAIRVQWKENGTDRYRDVGVGETGVVELVFSQGDTTKKEVKFAATRKDNGEAVLLNGGKSIAFMATSDKAAQSAVASNMPAYIVAEFRNDAGVAIRVQWKENGTDRYRDVGVGETGVVELVFSQGDTTKKEVKFAATRKDNGEAVLLNGGKSIAFMATSDKAAQSAVASNMPAYIVAEFRNDAGVAIRVQWKENGTDRYRDVGVGETGVVELVFSQGDTTKKEVKFAATRKDNGEAVLLNGGKSIAFMATSDKAAQSAVASNMPAYIVAEFRNDAGVAIRVQWKENGTDRYRDVGVGETGVVELVFSQGDTTKKEVKFAATRKDNGEAVLLNGGKSIAFMATSDKAAQSAVASNMPAYIVAEFRNDAGVAIRVQWKENGTDRYRDVGVGETGVVELVFSQGDTTKKEVKFAATRKDNGEAVLLNGGKSIAFMATSDKAAQSAVASNMPAYIVAEFRNDAGVAIRVQWKENGTDRYRDVGVGETGVVELVFSQGDTTKKEVKFAATRKDNGEAVLLNGGKSIAFMATSDKAAQSAVASNMPAYIVAEFRNDAGVAIRVQWKENGTDRYRDVGVGETGVVELVFSQGDTTKKEVKFAATRKDNGEAVLLNGGKSIAFMATSDKAAQSAVASNMPAYIVAEFRNDAGVAIRVQWKENGTDRYRDVGVGETGVVELVFSQGDTTKKEVKFAATRKDNGEAVLLNGGKSIAFMATSDKAAQSAVASNMPAYIVAEFRNDAGVAIRVQWKENGTDRYRDVGVGETGVVELVFSQGDTTKKEVKFAATRKDNGEAVLLNGGKSIAFMATSDKAAQSAVASNMPAYIVAEFRNDAGVAIRVQWKENGTDRYRDVGVGETGVVELVFSQGDTTKKEVKFAATRKDNGEAVLLNGGKSIAFMATSDKAAQSAVASNMPAYIVAEFRNDAGVAIRVQWKENGTDRYRDVGVGETGVVELVFSQGDTTKKEVKFAATRKDNGEAVLLNGGKSTLRKDEFHNTSLSNTNVSIPVSAILLPLNSDRHTSIVSELSNNVCRHVARNCRLSSLVTCRHKCNTLTSVEQNGLAIVLPRGSKFHLLLCRISLRKDEFHNTSLSNTNVSIPVSAILLPLNSDRHTSIVSELSNNVCRHVARNCRLSSLVTCRHKCNTLTSVEQNGLAIVLPRGSKFHLLLCRISLRKDEFNNTSLSNTNVSIPVSAILLPLNSDRHTSIVSELSNNVCRHVARNCRLSSLVTCRHKCNTLTSIKENWLTIVLPFCSECQLLVCYMYL